MSKRAAKASWNEMLESHKGQQPFPHTAHGITINLKKTCKASPATNHIVACPACPATPMKQYFWSYNMPTHFARAHVGLPMPPALAQEIALSAELAGLAALKVPQLSKRKRQERDERDAEKRNAAKLARLAEEEAAQPLGRGQRHAARAAQQPAAPAAPAIL